jgi:D-3-phosphoglycerate dehydrogenase
MKILCADALAAELLQPLRDAGHEVFVEPDLDADSLPARLEGDTVEVLVVRSTKVTEAALSASSSLGLVVRAGAGTDNVDKNAASALGIYVSNVPGQNAVAVAELAMALLLAIDRHIASGMADLRSGAWNKGTYSKADGILGKELAIVGLGEIGFALAERARAFGMTISALRKPGRSDASLSRIRSAGIRLVDTMDELLANADVVSLHVPKAPETVGMVNADFLSKMKDGAILLNTARGEVVDEAALLAAMDERGIRAGLDVWPGEPSGKSADWTSALSTHPNVVGSHHIGASTAQAQAAVASGTVGVIEAYLAGRVVNCVNLVDEPMGAVVLTVRHLDKVGVLAKVFATLREAGANVQQMENQLFVGSVAAVASINLDHEPDAGTLQQIAGDDDILAVSLSHKAV